ncbi:MAG: uridine kinase [Brevefilum sp.]
MNRDRLIGTIAGIIAETPSADPLRVAVDGVDAAGKTVFANELAKALGSTHRQVIRASVDGFHLPKAVRRQQGPLSPEGFYMDSYNYPALIELLLLPLSLNGDRQYRTAVFDVRRDRAVQVPWQTAENDAILVFDGIFLLRPALLPYWDLTIFLHADFENTIARGVARDRSLFQSEDEARHRYEQRYIPGQKIYFIDAHPLDKADILIDNNILEDPEIINKLETSQRTDHRKE